jgi:hypothetical protein
LQNIQTNTRQSHEARNRAVVDAVVNNTSSVMVRAVVNTVTVDAANIVTTADIDHDQQEQEKESCEHNTSSS